MCFTLFSDCEITCLPLLVFTIVKHAKLNISEIVWTLFQINQIIFAQFKFKRREGQMDICRVK
jgi:hypothetical protein